MKSFASIILPALMWVGPAFAQGQVNTEDFVNKVAISDMTEIQSSQLTLSRSPDADTKPFAKRW
jgi:predicted outer membrane protein